MNRRRVLSICAGLSLSTAGCLESMRDPGTPRIAITAVQVDQGDQSTIAAEAKNVESMEFDSGPVGSNTGIQFNFDQAEYSDLPDSMEDSFPPTLHWSSATNVTLEIPVTVAGENPPGEHQYTISVSNDSVLHGGASADEEFTITVTEA